jgi:hypothetical protein
MGITLMIYVLLGIGYSEMANMGHSLLYGSPLPFWIYILGVFFWLPMMIIGGTTK